VAAILNVTGWGQDVVWLLCVSSKAVCSRGWDCVQEAVWVQPAAWTRGLSKAWKQTQGLHLTTCTQNVILLQRQGCYDTATSNKGTDDDKMDVCGPEERKASVGTLQAGGSGDWFE
jgi:hypothetical protein